MIEWKKWSEVKPESIVIDENTLIFQEAMNNYEFIDGTPFGIKE